MCSNYNYQNLWGKISRIIKFSKTVSPYTYLKSTKCHNMKLLKFLILAIFFNIICPLSTKHLKSTILNNCEVINKYKIIFQYHLCMYTISSAWGNFSKILHNIHIEAVTRHLDVFCNILLWKMSNWVCCDCPNPIWVWYHQN